MSAAAPSPITVPSRPAENGRKFVLLSACSDSHAHRMPGAIIASLPPAIATSARPAAMSMARLRDAVAGRRTRARDGEDGALEAEFHRDRADRRADHDARNGERMNARLQSEIALISGFQRLPADIAVAEHDGGAMFERRMFQKVRVLQRLVDGAQRENRRRIERADAMAQRLFDLGLHAGLDKRRAPSA